MRIVLPSTTGTPSESRRCKKDGCASSTRDGKPFCPNHVEEADYPQSLLEELKKRRTEVALLLKGEEIPDDGHLVRETLLLLAWSACTERRLGRMLDIPYKAVEILVEQLQEVQRVRKNRTPRGSVIVEIILPQPKADKSKTT
jgi:hypothetical protein